MNRRAFITSGGAVILVARLTA
jgi:hypothetical protein